MLEALIQGRWQHDLAAKTYALYEMVWRTRIQTAPIGQLPISSVEPADVEEWILGLQRTLKPASALRYYGMLRSVLPKRCVEGVKPPQVPETTKQVLSPEQVRELLEVPMKPRLRMAVVLCLHGLAMGEALGLTVEDVTTGVAHVRRQVVEVNGRLSITEVLKTGRRDRAVPLGKWAQDELEAFLAGRMSGYIVQADNGKPWRPSNLKRDWDQALKGTKFHNVGRHDLRSTFGMLMLEGGVDVRTAAEIMGHSPEMLAGIYARSRNELRIKAVAQGFDAVFGRSADKMSDKLADKGSV